MWLRISVSWRIWNFLQLRSVSSKMVYIPLQQLTSSLTYDREWQKFRIKQIRGVVPTFFVLALRDARIPRAGKFHSTSNFKQMVIFQQRFAVFSWFSDSVKPTFFIQIILLFYAYFRVYLLFIHGTERHKRHQGTSCFDVGLLKNAILAYFIVMEYSLDEKARF